MHHVALRTPAPLPARQLSTHPARRPSRQLTRPSPRRACCAPALAARLVTSQTHTQAAAPLQLATPSVLFGLCVFGGAVLGLFLVKVLRTLSALVASAADIRSACAAVVVCTEAIVRACGEVEPLARDIRLDVESTRESVRQPLAKTTGALKKVSDDMSELKATLAVTAASVLAAAGAFLAL